MLETLDLKNLDKNIFDRPLFKEANDLVYWGKDVLNREQYIHRNAFTALQNLIRKANNDGVILEVLSIFRSYKYQEALIHRHLQTGKTIQEIVKKVALPGYSEHHTGLAIDFTTPEEDGLVTEAFEQTKAFRWLKKNAEILGFSMSYPKNNPWGMIYEPWHWLYNQIT
ncbi:D-alanyl-D-alanine carboxypeptidase family protein [Francisellaceae bacterium CB300]